MELREIANSSKKVLRSNAPAILTGFGISGTITTAYLAAKAGYRSAVRLSEGPPQNTPREIFEETWDLYIPAVASGVLTVGVIIMTTRVSSRRAAAAYSVLAVTERAFDEYREKVTDVLGENKEQKIRDEIAQSKVEKSNQPLLIADGDGVICCELHTGRYFRSNMESLRKAQNDINAKAIKDLYVTMDELYDILGLDFTTSSSNFGWDSEKQLELIFSSALTKDNKPCLAFEYNYVKPV